MGKLSLSQKNKKISGVFGGLGEYFNVDPIVLRLAYVFLCLFNPVLILFYPLAVLIIPRGDKKENENMIKVKETPEEENKE